jgi:hypothetical protein
MEIKLSQLVSWQSWGEEAFRLARYGAIGAT